MTVPERRRRHKYLEHARNQGVAQYIDNGPMQAHILELLQWITREEIAERADVSAGFMTDQLPGGKCNRVLLKHHNNVMAVRLTEDEKVTNEDRFRGARRIVLGLLARGFTTPVLAEYLPMSPNSLANLTCGTDKHWVGMYRKNYAAFILLAEKLDTADPADHGCSKRGITMNMTRGRLKGWAPLACWDLDTIHRADAYADWTGECGKPEGYYLHLKYSVHTKVWSNGEKLKQTVLCEPCLEARVAHREAYRKWSDADRAAILADIDAGGTVRGVAEEYGCSTRTVERFKKERRNKEG